MGALPFPLAADDDVLDLLAPALDLLVPAGRRPERDVYAEPDALGGGSTELLLPLRPLLPLASRPLPDARLRLSPLWPRPGLGLRLALGLLLDRPPLALCRSLSISISASRRAACIMSSALAFDGALSASRARLLMSMLNSSGSSPDEYLPSSPDEALLLRSDDDRRLRDDRLLFSDDPLLDLFRLRLLPVESCADGAAIPPVGKAGMTTGASRSE